MKLRNKIMIAICMAWLVFLGLAYIGSKFFLLQSFLELEKDRTNENLSRVDQALDQINYSLYTYTSDWSHWNDLYDFILGKKPAFVPDNLNMTAFVNSHVNLLTYWNTQGKLVVGSAINTQKQIFVPFPPGLEKYIYPGSSLLKRKDVNSDLRGYVLVSTGIYLVASSSVTDGDKILPPVGVSIFGRELDTDLVNKIADTTKVKLELFLPDNLVKNKELQNIFNDISKNQDGHYIHPLNEKYISGYSIIRDVNNQPIGMFRMTTSRSIYLTGFEAINYYLVTFVLLGLISSLLMLGLLRILIIKRLERLDDEVADIGAKQAITQRVHAEGKDELSSVATEINHLLDIIQSSHDELEHRVEERTKELQKTNVQLEQEITERKEVERELVVHKEHLIRLAHYDALTSLPNRVFFNEILNKAIKHAAEHNKLLAVLFIDLDRFKTINDALGHSLGDAVLKEMALRFSSVLRASDVLARLGGDEFIVLLNDIAEAKLAGPIAEKILKTCTIPIKLDTHEFYVGTSVGISIYPSDGESLEDLQRNADIAMYKAKHSGGGVYLYYTNEMDTLAHEHIKLETALRKAIEDKEFVLHFQPQLNLKTGKILRVEALIRWDSPKYGLIPPMKFIPLAEETGLILPIGEWAIHEACRINKKWLDDGYEAISIAVNISPKQFRHQDIAKIVEDSLADSNLDPSQLEIEITETAVTDNVEIAINKLNTLKSMGITISVDDFGTGYTSINYLRQFPVSILKIDQTFIKGLPQNQNDIAIATAVIALGHNLGLEIIAEGVETAEQLQFLLEHDCDYVQGYYLSRPVPEAKIREQLPKKGEAAKNLLEKNEL